MKIAPKAISGFLKAPDQHIRSVLLYGPDSGLAREYGEKLVSNIIPDPDDPFRLAEFSGAELGKDPTRLNDEAAAIAMTGGQRVVRIREAGEAQIAIFEDFLEHLPGDALIIVDSGDLGPRSKLRRLFETSEVSAALPCYHDEQGTIRNVIKESLAGKGLSIDRDALDFLTVHLGNDRMVTRQEIEKIALYKAGAAPVGPETLDPEKSDQSGQTVGKLGEKVTLQDVRACIGDGSIMDLDDLADAVGLGATSEFDRIIARMYADGENPITILRGMGRHFLRLHLASGVMATGVGASAAMKKLQPRVFFRRESKFTGQLNNWSIAGLEWALATLSEAEYMCKTTGMPANAVCHRALMRIGQAALSVKKNRNN